MSTNIPKLQIVQPGSPVLHRPKECFINGAEPGMIHDGVNAYDSVLLVLAVYRRKLQTWNWEGSKCLADLGAEGSPAAVRAIKKAIPFEDGGYGLWDGNRIVPVAQYVGYRVNEATGERQVVQLEFRGQQFDVARKWNSMFSQRSVVVNDQELIAPLFYNAYRLQAFVQAKSINDDPSNWFGWKLKHEAETPDLPDGANIYLEARALKKSILDGTFEFMAELETTHGQ